MRKTAACTLILISLMISGVVCVHPIKAEYQGDITVNADGSISPSTAPIKQTSNTYSITDDIDGSITVNTSDIILNGNGHTVSGVSLIRTLNVTVKNFVVASQSGRIGISLSDASNNLIVNNTVSGFWSIQALNGISFAGIYVVGGNSNTITRNNLMYNLDGMEFINTSHNLIVQNNITNNPVWDPYTTGIFFGHASNNTIYHNNFVTSKYQVNVLDSVNIWDNGYPDGGNYWSNYQTKYPNAAEIGNSGIGNKAYVIDSENQDRYPLMEPFKTPPQITLLSPLHQVYNGSSVDLVFTTDGVVNWTAYSLDGKQNVTVTGNSTITGIPSGSHKLVVYANDTFGRMGVSEELTFAVAVPEPSPLIFLGAGLGIAVLIVGLSLFVYVKKRLTASRSR